MGANHVLTIDDMDITWETPSHKLLAVMMALHADRKGVVRLSQEELADKVILSRQRVSQLLHDLCDLGVVKRLGHGRYGLVYGSQSTPKQATSARVTHSPQLREEQPHWKEMVKNDPGYSVRYDDEGNPGLYLEGVGRVE